MEKSEEFNVIIKNFYERNNIRDNIEDDYLQNFRNKFGKFLSQEGLKENDEIKQEILSIISNDYSYYSEEYTVKYLSKLYSKLIEHLEGNELTINDCHFSVILNKDPEVYNSSDVLTSLFMSINNIPNNLCKSFSRAVNYYYSDEPVDINIEKQLYIDFENILGEKTYLILIDDYSGTGKSINDFLNAIQKYIKNLYIEILIFCAHITEEAKVEIENNLKDNGIEFSILYINKTGKYFKNKEELEKKFVTFERKVVESGKKNTLGFKKTQSLITNYRNTPNNTISLFWYESINWKPLFKRNSKNSNIKWVDKVNEIKWFVSSKIVNEKERDYIIVLLFLKNNTMKSDYFEMAIKKIIKYNKNILQECLENKYLTTNNGVYYITELGLRLLENNQLNDVSLKTILDEYKAEGLHLQKNKKLNGPLI
ncbi:hypothetical protein BHU61_10595 [Macrococcus epidermidis]|uniref:PRTase-CE domain-containing protein n=1 Tax=Macrococcus epidermidis TaxID=1902580 RepID=A0A327ZNV5_9STAP|nr:hypothetical protein [Macrococcus epidermidis]RAK43989.1 hypothetical protein BHU61_10595 [Macrococcus epidermidis]